MNALLTFSLQTYAVFHREMTFRGHARSDWRLVPVLFRRDDDAAYEKSVIGEFIEQALSRMGRPPGLTERAKWLILMRHYGVPTRLLDWTLSPLVGIYFAVCNEKQDDCDGVMWACSRGHVLGLNDGSGDEALVARLIDNAFAAKRSQRVGALRGLQIDQRIRSQQGRFTIHGDPTPLEDYERSATCLRWARVPASRKAYFRAALEFLGLRRHELFPDLGSLARHLSRRKACAP